MLAINNKSLNTISLLTIATCIIYILFSVEFKDITDDHFFSTALRNYSLLDVLQIRYNTWSGRVLIEAFLMKTINIPLFPQITISLSFILLSYSISKMARNDMSATMPLIAISMLLVLSNFHTNRQATLWITGAYNYIIPVSIGMYAISIYIDRYKSTFKKTISCLLIFLSCNNEQFAVTAIIGVIVSLSLKTKNRELSLYDFIFTAFLICGGIIVLAAPGNVVRLHSEILNWMPDFGNYSILYKLSVGVDRISNQINFNDNFLFVICCLVSLAYLLITKQNSVPLTLAMSVLAIKVVTFILSFYPSSMASELLRMEDYISPKSWSCPSIYVTYLINLISLASILLTCLMASCTKTDAIKISVIMICGVLSALMIGFSPTAYASGTRVMFIFDISIVIAATFIFTRLTTQLLPILCGSEPRPRKH
ncbi:hypothetical protein D3C81_65410 [compost metagenome]